MTSPNFLGRVRAWVKAHPGSFTAQEVSKGTGVPVARVRESLYNLTREGLVRRLGTLPQRRVLTRGERLWVTAGAG